MNVTISKKTAEAIATLITSTREGVAGILMGQDLVRLNGPEAKTEADIMLESQAIRPERVDETLEH